jgi:two-component system, NarL family, response regulator NreC
MTTILLADDHAVVREGLRALLEDESDFEIIGEADCGLEAIRLAIECKPDVLVLDIMMDDITGIEVIRQVTKINPKTAIVVLSMYGDSKHVLEALKAGAKAYVVKKSLTSDLVQAVREVKVGHHYLGSSLAGVVVDAYIEQSESGPIDPYEMLSNREREVLNLAANGYTNSEIAERLNISRRTVETHRSNAMHKLNLSNQTELLRYALQRGIIPPE